MCIYIYIHSSIVYNIMYMYIWYVYVYMICMCIYIIYIYIYMSNLENPRFTECHTFAQKQYMENLGVSLAGKTSDLLDSRAEAALPFWFFAAGLIYIYHIYIFICTHPWIWYPHISPFWFNKHPSRAQPNLQLPHLRSPRPEDPREKSGPVARIF